MMALITDEKLYEFLSAFEKAVPPEIRSSTYKYLVDDIATECEEYQSIWGMTDAFGRHKEFPITESEKPRYLQRALTPKSVGREIISTFFNTCQALRVDGFEWVEETLQVDFFNYGVTAADVHINSLRINCIVDLSKDLDFSSFLPSDIKVTKDFRLIIGIISVTEGETEDYEYEYEVDEYEDEVDADEELRYDDVVEAHDRFRALMSRFKGHIEFYLLYKISCSWYRITQYMTCDNPDIIMLRDMMGEYWQFDDEEHVEDEVPEWISMHMGFGC